MKKAASDQIALDFIATVFPDAPQLAAAAFDEEYVLKTATETIKRLKAELASVTNERDEAQNDHLMVLGKCSELRSALRFVWEHNKNRDWFYAAFPDRFRGIAALLESK